MQLGKLSLSQSAKEIYTKEGFRAFYLSFPTTIAMSIPYQMIQFTCYESARKQLNPSGAYNPLSHCLAGN
jgi:solute carrier family 25 (mitochondrial iron transporter), member 28/37